MSDYSSFGGDPGAMGLSQIQSAIQFKTLRDLYMAVLSDGGLSPMDRQALVDKIRSESGAPDSTPLSALLRGGAGGVVGYLISRYFGMGVVGQLMASTLGMGIGSMLSRPQGGGLRTIGG